MAAIAGARCVLYINGNVRIGRGTQISAQENTQNVRVDEIGNFYTSEIEPVGAAVQGTIQKVSITNNGLKALGLDVNGDTIARLAQAAITIQIFDQVGEVVLWRIEGAKLESRGVELSARGLAMESLTFQALRLVDNRTP